ncbi:MAG: amidohydrolase [Chloroflexi bacterium]|nr:amidohydrolase [Chloroflexota bacterium]
MIIDSHSHAWRIWPYTPAVPDAESRGVVEQLLWEMDRWGVDQAVLVCAQIEHNLHNNDYVADAVKRYPNRLVQFADVDCQWSPTYHTPGAAARLAEAAEKYQLKGFTHYLKDDYDWFESAEGLAFFKTAAEYRLVASLALNPAWQPALRELAARFPEVPFVCHHMGLARVSQPDTLKEVLRSAELPNIYIKLSGFHYASKTAWDYPQTDTHAQVRALYDAFGPQRLLWGSDYPVVRFFMTYQHALEAFRTHCRFIPPLDQALILGLNLQELLERAGR